MLACIVPRQLLQYGGHARQQLAHTGRDVGAAAYVGQQINARVRQRGSTLRLRAGQAAQEVLSLGSE